MSPRDLIVRCIARREGDVWVALCVDLTLAVQGSSLPEVRRKLHEQITIYVREAWTVDAAHAVELLSRKGPFHHRLVYAWCWFRSRMRPALSRLVYKEALPLQLATA